MTGIFFLEHFNLQFCLLYSHKPVIEFQPGDEIRTVCHFKSTSRSDTTYYGDGTAEEMCFGFITYYPRIPDASACVEVRIHILLKYNVSIY